MNSVSCVYCGVETMVDHTEYSKVTEQHFFERKYLQLLTYLK